MTDAETLAAERAHQPDDAYFDLMAQIARTHWWYRARRAVLADHLAGRVRRGSRALDVGTGTGETLEVLRDAGAAVTAGTDLSLVALGHAHRRRPAPVVLSSYAEQLPFADATFACVTSTDVIEHLDDDVRALREYARVTEPRGWIVLTVPAYRGLWSEHDERAAHRRRYTASQLADTLAAAGLEVHEVTHLFSFLLLPALLLRCTPLRRFVSGTDDEAAEASPLLTSVFDLLCRVERRVLRGGLRLAAGLSILAVARVPEAGDRVTGDV